MGTNSKDCRGFSGLVAMVSDLSDLKPLKKSKRQSEDQTTSDISLSQGPAAKEHQSESQEQAPAPAWTSSEETSSGMPVDTKFVLWTVVMIAVVVLYVMSQSSPTSLPSNSLSPTNAQQAGSALSDLSGSDLDSDSNAERRSPVSQSAEPSRYDEEHLEYVKPPVGRNNILSIPEIRWCVRGGMQIEAMRGMFATNAGIDRFNEIVDDYNMRCGSYRYREGNLGIAQRQVEEMRPSIELAAIGKAIQLEKEAAANSFREPSTSEPEKSTANPEIVREAQVLLRVLGFNPGGADGLVGPNTEAAVRAFQQSQGMTVTGRVTTSLLQALRQEYRRRSTSN
ncbi:peptidoglycan-binding domain-containing protein [Marinobacter segnicrescens]|uniref:peptidoglycan-binding domain-containing protein n=1 Tax=Marinobacter segnicrescens TaxID=430453 RepID=UPI003A8EEE36